MKRIIKTIVLTFSVAALCSSCDKFIFGNIEVDYKDNALTRKKMPQTAADLYKAPIVTEQGLANPDPDGALKDWATCLVMFKEGHPHGGGKFHGNLVYDKAPWRQEEFVVIHNTSKGIKVEVDTTSTATYQEKVAGKKGPEYIRIIGGSTKLWGLCLFFYDRNGQPINDRILEQSERYQVFFSISDVDDKGKPFTVKDVRYRGKEEPDMIESKFFKDKKTFEQLREATRSLFAYTYRDTWTSDDMGDGTRELFNQKLLPPFERFKTEGAMAPYDQDWVGLKGHMKFDIEVDPLYTDWPVPLKNGATYIRTRNLLPYFYLAVRLMKCDKGQKAIRPMPHDESGAPLGGGKYTCAPYDAPHPGSNWKEMIRFNIPIKVYASTFDTDPTRPDPNEPYYVHLGREIGLTPEEAYEATRNMTIHGSGAFGSWFL